MRLTRNRITGILFLSALFFVSDATADSIMLTGTVQVVNHRNKELTLVAVSGPEWQETEEVVSDEVNVTLFAECRGQCDDRVIPGCAKVGKRVRIWGAFSQVPSTTGSLQRFHATTIRGAGGRTSHDATGVRSRIERGRKAQHKHPAHFHQQRGKP